MHREVYKVAESGERIPSARGDKDEELLECKRMFGFNWYA